VLLRLLLQSVLSLLPSVPETAVKNGAVLAGVVVLFRSAVKHGAVLAAVCS
jgi:hypothetical protein